MSCSPDVELDEPAIITMPVTLQEDKTKLTDLSRNHICIRTFALDNSRSQITSQLQTPAELENGVVSFQVRHFTKSRHVIDVSERSAEVVELLPSYESTPQDAGFLACLCANLDNYLIILCCFPLHLKAVTRKEICQANEEARVILEGEKKSEKPLKKGDEIAFSLPDALTPCEEKDRKDRFLRFFENNFSQIRLPVRFQETETSPSIEFFRRNGNTNGKETLCTLTIVSRSPPQVTPQLPEPSTSHGTPVVPPQPPEQPSTSQVTSVCEHEQAENAELRNKVLTLEQIVSIKEVVGSSWFELGRALKIEEATLRDIEAEYISDGDRTCAVFLEWKDKERDDATVGRIEDALNQRKDLAELADKFPVQSGDTETDDKGEMEDTPLQDNSEKLKEDLSFETRGVPEGHSARRTEVTGTHVLEICDDIGTCWHDLGIRLKLPIAVLENINVDHRFCREKAREMLYKWMKREGRSATVGSLADALEKIENRRVAHKLLAHCSSSPKLDAGQERNDKSRKPLSIQ